jgi:polyferredoxin
LYYKWLIGGNALSIDRKLSFKDFLSLIIMIIVFYTIAITLWLIFDSIFYLANFIIIGTSLALGLGLWPILSKKKKYRARKLSQALIGGYMFFGLGFGLIYIFFGYIQPENMQFEAFWFYLFSGIYTAAVLHYLIAKIIGPFLFNRGWCGWACWTAAILDYLPWEKSPGRIKKIGIVRYIHFIIGSLIIIILFFVFNYTLNSISGVVSLTGTALPETINIYNNIFIVPEFWWFIIGNIFYFLIGIILAAVLKDNRAFCKYLCPITVFMKIGSKLSILKIEGSPDTCIQCKACSRSCPMDLNVHQYINKGMRVTSSECIWCMNCINACPKNILKITYKLDKSYREFIRYKE